MALFRLHFHKNSGSSSDNTKYYILKLQSWTKCFGTVDLFRRALRKVPTITVTKFKAPAVR